MIQRIVDFRRAVMAGMPVGERPELGRGTAAGIEFTPLDGGLPPWIRARSVESSSLWPEFWLA